VGGGVSSGGNLQCQRQEQRQGQTLALALTLALPLSLPLTLPLALTLALPLSLPCALYGVYQIGELQALSWMTGLTTVGWQHGSSR